MDLSRFLQAIRQGCVDPFGAARYWKDAPSPPAAPDYKGAAEATAAGNLQQAQQATAANRVNQYSPYGSSTYSQSDPSNPASPWSQQISLSPTGQSLLDSLNNSQLGIAGLQGGATGQVADTMGGGFNYNGPTVTGSFNAPGLDLSGVPKLPEASEAARQAAEQAAYGRATSRLDPQWNDRQTDTETQLRNQGLVPGGEAYDKAERNLTFARNDAYDQARMGAVQQGLQAQQAQFGMGLAANNQGYQQALGSQNQMFNQGLAGGNFNNSAAAQALQQQLALYNQPLNQLNALRSASQVTNPQFGSVPQQQAVGGANYAGAAQQSGLYDQNLYNQGIGVQNQNTSGMVGLAGAAAMFF